MADSFIYLTQEGLTKLQEELRYLKEDKRVEIAEKLKEAISYGDLSENSEYEDARNEQSQVELRITELEDQLKNAKLIEEDKKSKSGEKKVNMGMTVTVQEAGSKEKETYKIVGTTEADILAETPRVSNESQFGKQLLGKKIGDSVSLKNGAGESISYKILEVA
ncbi:transcription elongation factor GreA [Candidatus Gracilibacteria bacterium]|nr:transcription elongation factor GreA [Candidatus Gracilibacteria bacterium]